MTSAFRLEILGRPPAADKAFLPPAGKSLLILAQAPPPKAPIPGSVCVFLRLGAGNQERQDPRRVRLPWHLPQNPRVDVDFNHWGPAPSAERSYLAFFRAIDFHPATCKGKDLSDLQRAMAGGVFLCPLAKCMGKPICRGVRLLT